MAVCDPCSPKQRVQSRRWQYWGELDPAYASCSGGTEQSPIDVTGANGDDLANIEFDYHEVSPLHIINNGHTEQIGVPEGSSHMTLDGKMYPLKQFHFVHITEEGAIAVVGVMLAESDKNAALKAVFEAMPAMAGPQQEVDRQRRSQRAPARAADVVSLQRLVDDPAPLGRRTVVVTDGAADGLNGASRRVPHRLHP